MGKTQEQDDLLKDFRFTPFTLENEPANALFSLQLVDLIVIIK